MRAREGRRALPVRLITQDATWLCTARAEHPRLVEELDEVACLILKALVLHVCRVLACQQNASGFRGQWAEMLALP